MLVTIKKKITQESQVELALPSYYKDHFFGYMICENGDVLTVNKLLVTVNQKGEVYYDSAIEKVLALKECTREEFMEFYSAALETFSTSILSTKESATV